MQTPKGQELHSKPGEKPKSHDNKIPSESNEAKSMTLQPKNLTFDSTRTISYGEIEIQHHDLLIRTGSALSQGGDQAEGESPEVHEIDAAFEVDERDGDDLDRQDVNELQEGMLQENSKCSLRPMTPGFENTEN